MPNWSSPLQQNPDPVAIKGHYHDDFLALIQAFKRIQPPPGQGGSALTVYFRGQAVVDVWAGNLRPDSPWQQDSMALSFSTGKAMLATLVHKLVDDGVLDYDRPIAYYWPQFATNGKAGITLRQVLSHQSGLFDIRNTIQSAGQMLDWPLMLEQFAHATPRFTPGTQTAYQALSFGWLLGGVIEQATKQPFSQVFDRHLVQPLQLDGAYFGVPQSELARVAHPIEPPVTPTLETASTRKARPALLPNGRRPLKPAEKLLRLTGLDPYDAEDALMPKGVSRFSFYHERSLQACIPAANGVFTARALACMYAMLANQGHWQQQPYLGAGRVKLLSEIQTRQRDRIMGIPMNWRMGYHRVITLGKRVPQAFGHIGYNGSGAWCDSGRQLSFAYVHNFAGSSITGDPRLWRLTQAALQCADQQLTGKSGWF